MKLGKTQYEVLQTLVRKGVWFPGCGWTWDTVSGTTRIMDSLLMKDAAFKMSGKYYPTPAASAGRFADLPAIMKNKKGV